MGDLIVCVLSLGNGDPGWIHALQIQSDLETDVDLPCLIQRLVLNDPSCWILLLWPHILGHHFCLKHVRKKIRSFQLDRGSNKGGNL